MILYFIKLFPAQVILIFGFQCVSLASSLGKDTSNNPAKLRPIRPDNDGPRRLKPLILISFDGFRWDYLETQQLKSFNFIAQNGVRARSLESSFITKTFPNHFTLVTGLHEESHGIMANRMYDPVFDETFEHTTTDPKWWNAAKPIWIRNEEANNDINNKQESKDSFNKTGNTHYRKSAAIFWVGSNVKYGGRLPYFYMPFYNGSYTLKDRFDLILKLLKEKEPPNFIACYFDEPDAASHQHGPDSDSVKTTLKIIDNLFSNFLEEIKKMDYLDQGNIVIVSDHGMATIEPQNQIVLDNFIDPSWYIPVNIDIYATLIPNKNYSNTIYDKLKQIPHLTVYHKKDIPEDFHYKNNRRVPPIFAMADEGYIITRKKKNITHRTGNHGYFNKLKSMHGIFLAIGPSFKKGYIGETFKNIHVYPLLCHLLEIEPSPNNGSLLQVKHFLATSQGMSYGRGRIVIVEVILVCSIVLLVTLLIGCCLQLKRKPQVPEGYVILSQTREGISLDILTEDLAIAKSSDEDDI